MSSNSGYESQLPPGKGWRGGCKPTRKACPIKVSLTACNYNFSCTCTRALETVQAFLFPTPPLQFILWTSNKQIRNWRSSQNFGTPQGSYLTAQVTSSGKQLPHQLWKSIQKCTKYTKSSTRFQSCFSEVHNAQARFLRYSSVPV